MFATSPFLLLLFLLVNYLTITTAQTSPPTLHLPSSSVHAAIGATFVIDYTLSEPALAGSVKFEMDPFPDDVWMQCWIPLIKKCIEISGIDLK